MQYIMMQLLANKLCACMRWFEALFQAFDLRFLLSLIVIQHVLKGLVLTWVRPSIPFIFKEYGNVSAVKLSTYKAIAMIPWSIKPIMGFCSDLVPICGYHKRYYMAVATIVSLVRKCASSALLLYSYI